MAELGAGIAVQQAIVRQNASLSMIKNAANNDKEVANMIAEAAETVTKSGSRGGNVNLLV